LSARNSRLTNKKLPTVEKDPAIRFDSDTPQVIITGAVAVGSEKCKTADLDSVNYDSDTNTLQVTVTHAKSNDHPDNKLLGGSCDDAMSMESYRTVVVFDNGLPKTITAIENNLPEGVPSQQETQRTTLER
jgi:hypothetical protein